MNTVRCCGAGVLVALSLCSCPCWAAAPKFDWAVQVGGDIFQELTAVARTAEDGAVAVGHFGQTLSVSGVAVMTSKSDSAFVLKVDASGKPVWSKPFDGPGVARAVAVDAAGNVLVAGQFTQSMTIDGVTLTNTNKVSFGGSGFAAKFDPDGKLLWATRQLDEVGGGGAGTAALRLTADGDVILAGQFVGWNDMMAPTNPVYTLIRLSGKDGSKVWASVGTGLGPTAMAIGADGRIYTAGLFGPKDVQVDGVTLHIGSANPAKFLMAYDDKGHAVWGTMLPSTGSQAFGRMAMALGAGDTIYLTGQFHTDITFGAQTYQEANNGDAFLARFDAAGKLLWGRAFGSTGFDAGSGVCVDSSGNVLFSGSVSSSVDGEIDLGGSKLSKGGHLYVARYDPDGRLFWATQTTSSNGKVTNQAMGCGPDGVAFLTGSVLKSAQFDGILVEAKAKAGADAFLARLAASKDAGPASGPPPPGSSGITPLPASDASSSDTGTASGDAGKVSNPAASSSAKSGGCHAGSAPMRGIAWMLAVALTGLVAWRRRRIGRM